MCDSRVRTAVSAKCAPDERPGMKVETGASVSAADEPRAPRCSPRRACRSLEAAKDRRIRGSREGYKLVGTSKQQEYTALV